MEIFNIDLLQKYLREFSTHRKWLAVGFFVIAMLTLVAAFIMPKSYTSTATIYADDSNILRPLMAGAAVATEIVDQARLAQETLFRREFNDEVLEAAGYTIGLLSGGEKEDLIKEIKSSTRIDNEVLGTANLVRISNTDSDPTFAYNLTEKYTSLFIEQSISNKLIESQSAFDFIQRQVADYLEQLVIAENSLSAFKAENNEGTLLDANNRVARYRERVEALELESFQLATEQSSIESVLAGENAVVQDLSEVNTIMARINALQINLDSLRAVYRDGYPDIVQVKAQIADLNEILASESTKDGYTGSYLAADNLEGKEGVTSLHQRLRTQLAEIQTTIKSNETQRNAIRKLLSAEEERVVRITATEGELAGLTRDYNITLKTYTDMQSRMESAKVSMHLDEEEQGVTFKIQEPAVVPLEANGLRFYQLLVGSFIVALGLPLGLLVMYVELDNRIRSESEWSPEWPPLLMVIPPHKVLGKTQVSNQTFILVMAFLGMLLYVSAGALYLYMKFNQTSLNSFLGGF